MESVQFFSVFFFLFDWKLVGQENPSGATKIKMFYTKSRIYTS